MGISLNGVNGVSPQVSERISKGEYIAPVSSDEKIQTAENRQKFDRDSSSQSDREQQEATPVMIKEAAEAANKIAKAFKTAIKFEVHEDTNIEMMRIVDARTGDVIREIPPKEVLDMIGKLWDAIGVFVDTKA